MTALSCMDILPSLNAVRLVDSRREENLIVFVLESIQTGVVCPECGVLSDSIHSSRTRIIHDLPIFGSPVQIHVSTRCFRCTNLNCPRKWFREQIPGLTVRYQRRTPRAQEHIVAFGMECGGESSERLGRMIGLSWSADTFLRAVRSAPELNPSYEEVHVLGVDDWAMRKGQRYGTLCYDVEHHRPLDLLPDRESHTLSRWMKETLCQPAKVTRDGSQTYREAIDSGSPQSLQIADRFHIKKNFNDAAERLVKRLLHSYPPTPAGLNQSLQVSSGSIQERPNDSRRRTRWEQIHALNQQGYSHRSIAKQLGVGRSTVRNFLQMNKPPAPQRWSHRKIDPYITYLQSRWDAGTHNVKQLYGEIRNLGFQGRYSQLAAHLSSWRGTSSGTKPSIATPTKEWYRRWMRQSSQHEPETETELMRWLGSEPELQTAYQLSQAFIHLFRERDTEALKQWMNTVESSEVRELRSFAKGLSRDEAAVFAAFSEKWSNGPVEASVNSLKTIKRQMYGRGKLDLLRKRYLNLAVRRRKPDQHGVPKESLIMIHSR